MRPQVYENTNQTERCIAMNRYAGVTPGNTCIEVDELLRDK